MTLLEDRPAQIVRSTEPRRLQTARLILRAPVLEDARAIAALANDIRIGLARAYDRLTPELRQAIRSAVATPRNRAAA